MPDQGWEKKVIGGVHIVVPKECKTDTQNKPGTGVVKKMTKLSFKTAAIDLELVFLEFPPGFSGNIDGAAANMGAQIKAALGEDAFTQWNAATISGRPARCLATKPSPTNETKLATIIDDTRATNQLIIIDISYDSTSTSGRADSERIMKSVEIK
jgi:hypothetical protein